LLREDGSGAPYAHPGQLGEGDYFHVPYAYWEGHFPDRLDLSGKTVLLIALSLKDDFVLPLEHGSHLVRGVGRRAALRAADAADAAAARRPSPAKAGPAHRPGVTEERRYTLRGPLRPQAGAIDPDDPTPPY